MIERSTCINLIQASFSVNRLDYARTVAGDWLATWPQDAEVILLLAEAEFQDGLYAQAIDRLMRLIELDPEYIEAYQLLAEAYFAAGDPHRGQVYDACRRVLEGDAVQDKSIPRWARPLSRAMESIDNGNHKKAMSQAKSAMEADPNLTLPTLIRVRAYELGGKPDKALEIASVGHDRWPSCIYFRLLIALDLIQHDEPRRGVDQLHKIAGDDPTGRIVSRYLDSQHPYRSLWPERMTGQLSRPIPAEVFAILGANRIPAQSTVPGPMLTQSQIKSSHIESIPSDLYSPVQFDPQWPEDHSEDTLGTQSEPQSGGKARTTGDIPKEEEILLHAQREFTRLAARLKVRSHKKTEDVRVPAYIVLSSRTRLIEIFGEEKFRRINEAIQGLVEIVNQRPGWHSYGLFVDDVLSCEPFGLSPVDPRNPWKIKLCLTDLDAVLQNQGEMIGSVLIVGGHEIVPFHMLPNPTDDDDDMIPSDNPYSTTDSNYFAPEWPVGRFPTDADPDLLVDLIRAAIDEHTITLQESGPVNRLVGWIRRILNRIFQSRPSATGYSASIWRKASLAVFRAIGNPRSMVTSPPAEAGALPSRLNRPTLLSYYNLHGLEDSPEWFGQRDPIGDSYSSLDFPIALRPQDITNSGRSPRVVFTEACYGAHVLQKTSQSAICLRFLESGSQAVVGSTKISYGSVTPPLIAADLLGRLFWDDLNKGLPVGEALRRAKLQLAAEMHQRQGYLDGEDQKSLISFVLYGDPLFVPQTRNAQTESKVILRKKTRPAMMKTACARGGTPLKPEEIEPVMLNKVRSIVTSYLPGMSDAQCKIHHQRHECDGTDHLCPTHQLNMSKAPRNSQPTVVVTFSKHIAAGDRSHPHFARLTMDDQGKVLKLAVSR
ncbi:MAG: hypothetical protein GTO18_02810 [Anaerolineales bacterium]|nr:hypothetical protein [Anaerolineales bacterium]